MCLNTWGKMLKVTYKTSGKITHWDGLNCVIFDSKPGWELMR